MIKFTFTFEIEEENLKDLFENKDVKFSKKKVKELLQEINNTGEHAIQEELQEHFEEVIEDWIDSVFN